MLILKQILLNVIKKYNVDTTRKNNVDMGDYRFTIFNICSHKSHLSYRTSESVRVLSGPVWIVFWSEGFFI
jgi:hypothetical protein